jgi:hypothetical protein
MEFQGKADGSDNIGETKLHMNANERSRFQTDKTSTTLGI